MANLFETIAVRYMTDLIRDFDLEDFQAAGFPGNFGVESTGFTDVTENNPASGAGGLGHAQWTGRSATNNRRLLFEQYIEKRRSLGMSAAPDDYETNYGMVFRELDGAEGRRVLPKLRLARNVDDAVEIVMTEYERPGVPHLDKRKEYGRRALAAFRAAGIDAAALRQQERPGGQVVTTGGTPPPATGSNPIGGIVSLIENHQEEARSKVLQVVGIYNAVYPANQIVVQADAPKIEPKSEQKPVSERPSIALGLLGLLTSGGLMSAGTLGTPFGMGEQPTTAGTIATVASAATSILGMFGGWGKVAQIALPLLGGLGKVLTSAGAKK